MLVEIDVTALGKKSATSNLKKRFIGTSGTGFGRLYGLGAWGGEAFAFQRFSTSGATTTMGMDWETTSSGRRTRRTRRTEVISTARTTATAAPRSRPSTAAVTVATTWAGSTSRRSRKAWPTSDGAGSR